MCSYFGGVCLVSATRGTRDYTLPKRSLGLGDHNLSSLYFISNTDRRRLWTQRLFSVYLGTDNRILSLGSISNCPVGHSWVITVLNKAGKHIKGKRQNRSIWFSCRTKTHDNRPGRVQFSVILLKINPSPASNPTKSKLIFFPLLPTCRHRALNFLVYVVHFRHRFFQHHANSSRPLQNVADQVFS